MVQRTRVSKRKTGTASAGRKQRLSGRLSPNSAMASNGQAAKHAPLQPGRHFRFPVQPRPLGDALRVGLCGLGRGAITMLQRDMLPFPFARIVACTDLLPERAHAVAAAVGAQTAADLDALLKIPQVELVVISTRTSEHATMAARALRAGKHVLVEKPIATTLAETDKLLALAKKSEGASGARLFVRHNRRFDAPFQLAQQVAESGKIGKLFAFSLRVHRYNPRGDWQTLRRFGGGELLNWGSHMLDWALQLLGSEVVDVWADMRRIVAGGDAEDHVKIILRGASGVVGDVEVSSGAALGAPPWHLLGTRGSLIIEGNHAKLKYLAGKGVPKVKASSATPAVGPADINAASLKWLEESPPLRPMPGQFWKSLYRSIRKGAVFPIKLQEVRELMRVIELARKAADRPMPRQRRAVKN